MDVVTRCFTPLTLSNSTILQFTIFIVTPMTYQIALKSPVIRMDGTVTRAHLRYNNTWRRVLVTGLGPLQWQSISFLANKSQSYAIFTALLHIMSRCLHGNGCKDWWCIDDSVSGLVYTQPMREALLCNDVSHWLGTSLDSALQSGAIMAMLKVLSKI